MRSKLVVNVALLTMTLVLQGCFLDKLLGKKSDSTQSGSTAPSTNTTTTNPGTTEATPTPTPEFTPEPDWTPTPTPTATPAIPKTPNMPNGKQDTQYQFQPDAPAPAANYTWSATGLPTWAKIDDKTGIVTGIPDDPGTYAITIRATDAAGVVTPKNHNVTITGDPLTKYAWHMNNTGQKTFAINGGTAGEDMLSRAASSWGVTGAGINVAVSDTGIAINHADLKNRLVTGGSRNYNSTPVNNKYAGDPTPAGGAENTDDNAHGTCVAGIVGAEKWNGIGASGIAPGAKLMGFNYLTASTNTAAIDVDQISSYEGNLAVDIFNQSWGYNNLEFVPLDSTTYRDALKNGTRTYRGGKGALYVRSAGNGYIVAQSAADKSKILSQNANSQEVNTVPYITLVGAMNAKGVRTSYTSQGSAVWVSGMGGEFGDKDPAILTTDFPGNLGFSHNTSKPYVYTAQNATPVPANSFESGTQQATLNANYDYTSIMNGTSSAAPSVAAVMALMLEANPNLSWRDVNYILARTATKVDAAFAPIHCGFDVAGHINEPGWIKNATGFNFHNSYGFGRVNAKAAVEYARFWTPTSPNLTNKLFDKTPTTVAIPDKDANGISDSVQVNIDGDPRLFTVLLRFTSTHKRPAELQIELTSPRGTKSVVLSSCNSFVGDDVLETTLTNAAFRSNAFLDERVNGKWTITVKDVSNIVFNGEAAGTTHTGNFTNYKLDFYY